LHRIRPATAADQPTIRQMVVREKLDPTTLKWQNFLVAEIEGDPPVIVGIGQIKPYPGAPELGSLVVLREYRGQGIAADLIAALEARAPRPLYLLCQNKMQSYYGRFGYRRISFAEAPRPIKLKLLPTFAFRLFGVQVIAMCKD
jgi:amino-acid N-acetyltransferase